METTIIKKPKLLLHICCAGCGAYVSKLLESDYDLVLYFQNSNIYPEAEYLKRREEVERIAKKFDLELIYDDYDHKQWLAEINGYENEKEKGRRCYLCYQSRMERLAQKAKDFGFDAFSTTLSVSSYKVYSYIKEIGDALAFKFGLIFHDQDFKKQNGSQKAAQLSRELELYRQNYCGCEFSQRILKQS